jgi:hypothetical protein
VVHNGSTAGGFPIAREDLANVSPTNLPTITGDATAADDKFLIYDQSALALKQITRAELNNAIEQDALANVSITGGTINGTTIGGTTAAGGSFTTLNSSGATTLNGTTIPASKTLVDTDTAQTLTNKTLSTGTAITAGTINNTSIGASTASTGAFTTLTTSSTVTHNGGTANGVAYLNGSKVLTTGSALTFDGFNQTITAATNGVGFRAKGSANGTNINAATSRGGTIGLYNLDTTNGNANAVEFYNSNELTSSFISGVNVSHSGRTGELVFGTANGAAPSEQMRLTNAGNVGIGTSAPAQTLEVRKSTNAGIRLSVSDTEGIEITQAAAGNSPRINVLGTGLDLAFNMNTTERMRITSAGNVGIGLTNPATFGRLAVQGDTTKTIGVRRSTDGTNASPAETALIQGFATSGASSGAGIFHLNSYANSANDWLTFKTTSGGTLTERMRIDSAGNVGIGTTDPTSGGTNALAKDLVISRGTGVCGMNLIGSENRIWFSSNSALAQGFLNYNQASNFLGFGTNNTERMRIDSSGNLLVGTTSVGPGAGNTNVGCALNGGDGIVYGSSASGASGRFNRNGDGELVRCFRSGNQVGNISVTASATAYNTSSDYRLKNTIAPMTGALAKVALLKPCTYKWNADGSDGEGFIAHELAEVIPQCVTGQKDAVDAEGKPQYQGIDVSFLVATLTAAIQEQQALIQTLTARVAALESI